MFFKDVYVKRNEGYVSKLFPNHNPDTIPPIFAEVEINHS